MNPVMISGGINARFIAAMQWLISLGFTKDNIMETMIQSFDPLASGKTNLFITLCQKFISTQSLAADPTLNLVGQNDAFLPVGFRQVIRKRYAAAPNFANVDIVGYPDKTIFNFTGEEVQVRSAYNGARSSLQVETTTVIESIVFNQLGFAGNPQDAAATVSATGSPNSYDKFTPIQKSMIISGLTNAQFVTGLFGFTPAAAITGDTNENNDMGFQLVGLTIKGAGQQVADMAQSQGAKCLVK